MTGLRSAAPSSMTYKQNYPGQSQDAALLKVSGLEIEVERRGRGRPLLVLYGEEALERDAPVLAELAKDYELIIPSPPGFGTSERPDWIEVS